MENTLKSSKNIIKIGGKTYYSFVYLERNKKSFDKADFIVVKNTSYYLTK
jgi:hypothetical protein